MKLPAYAALLVAALALSSCELAPNHPQANLVISPQGALTLEGRSVTEQDLPQALKAIRERAPGTELLVRTDAARLDVPNFQTVGKIVSESGLSSTYTALEEQERVRRGKKLLFQLLFYGGSMLLAVCVVTPFALRARTASSARSIAIAGILALGSLIGVLIGGYMNYRPGERGAWLVGIFLLIYFVPLSLVTGVIVGNLCGWIVRRRTRTPAPAP